MDKLKIIIGHLYGDLMNIYGDRGNIIALQKRAQWRGIEVEVKNISLKNQLPTPGVGTRVDLYFFGGGQDQSQELVAQNLVKSNKGKIIKEEVKRGVPLLSVCGGYQLLGEYYLPRLASGKAGKPHKGPKLPGIGLFPVYTIAGYNRMIGNIVIKSSVLSRQSSDSLKTESEAILKTDSFFVGFENHSGKTFLKKGAQPFGKVIKGFGNNGEDQTEGCIYKNAIGTYMHGSLLPKNPKLTDWLISKALEVKYGSPRSRFGEATPKAGEAGKTITLKPLDDELENKAHDAAISRFG